MTASNCLWYHGSGREEGFIVQMGTLRTQRMKHFVLGYRQQVTLLRNVYSQPCVQENRVQVFPGKTG